MTSIADRKKRQDELSDPRNSRGHVFANGEDEPTGSTAVENEEEIEEDELEEEEEDDELDDEEEDDDDDDEDDDEEDDEED